MPGFVGRWRDRMNRARRYYDPNGDGIGEFYIGFREVDGSQWYEAAFPHKCHTSDAYRIRDYEPKTTVDSARRQSQSFTNRLRSIDWGYYLQMDT